MISIEPTIFVIDDEDATRQKLNSLLKSIGIQVVTFRSAKDFLNDYDPACPGCLVSEIRLPGISGLELQELLLSKDIDIPMIFVSRYGDVPTAVRAMKMGALDFFVKPVNDQVLLERIQQGIRQDAQTRRERLEQEELARRYGFLTEREQQIMDYIVAGKPNKVIANTLKLSQKTVEFHRSNVMEKMKAESLAQLVKIDFRLTGFRESPRSGKGKLSFRSVAGPSMEEIC